MQPVYYQRYVPPDPNPPLTAYLQHLSQLAWQAHLLIKYSDKTVGILIQNIRAWRDTALPEDRALYDYFASQLSSSSSLECHLAIKQIYIIKLPEARKEITKLAPDFIKKLMTPNQK